jgi:hypothetical protein
MIVAGLLRVADRRWCPRITDQDAQQRGQRPSGLGGQPEASDKRLERIAAPMFHVKQTIAGGVRFT